MLRVLLSTSLLFGCATTQSNGNDASRETSMLPGTSEFCEPLTQPDDDGPYAAIYRCRLEGQVCIVMQFASPLGGLAMDCEDEEGRMAPEPRSSS